MNPKFKKPVRRPRRQVRKSTKVNKTFVKKVQAVISKNIEDKYVTLVPGQSGAINPGVPASADPGDGILMSANVVNIPALSTVYPLLPPLLVGTADHERIGDKIRPKSLVVKFQIALNGQGAATTQQLASQNIYARLMCLSDKAIKFIPDLVNNLAVNIVGTPVDTQLLDLGDGSSSGIGVLGPNEFSKRINRKKYTVHHDKILKLQKGVGGTNQPTGLVFGTLQYNSPLMTHMLTLRIPCPKSLSYNLNGASYLNYPNNFAPFFCMALMTMDGQQNPAYQTNLNNSVKLNYVVHFDYEDA